MATAEAHWDEEPAGMPGTVGELAPVIPIGPSQSEKGFFDRVSHAATHLANVALGHPYLNSDAMPHGVVVKDRRAAQRYLVTEPDSQTGVDPQAATNSLLKPGLTELGDLGSHLRLHVEYAKK